MYKIIYVADNRYHSARWTSSGRPSSWSCGNGTPRRSLTSGDRSARWNSRRRGPNTMASSERTRWRVGSNRSIRRGNGRWSSTEERFPRSRRVWRQRSVWCCCISTSKPWPRVITGDRTGTWVGCCYKCRVLCMRSSSASWTSGIGSSRVNWTIGVSYCWLCCRVWRMTAYFI